VPFFKGTKPDKNGASNVCQNEKRNETNLLKRLNVENIEPTYLPIYFPYVAAAVSLSTTEKEMLR
jgi:hypothetical protein